MRQSPPKGAAELEEFDHVLDWEREKRTGIGEAIFAEGKTAEQIAQIVRETLKAGKCLFVTRLSEDVASVIGAEFPEDFQFRPSSHTAVIGSNPRSLASSGDVIVVAAGTSDMRVAREAAETLEFYGYRSSIIADVGVAGLWRLLGRLDEIRRARVVIAVAGMEGALFSVLSGLIAAPLIAVPTSVGYGVSRDGKAALSSALATCSPGVLTVNIDNGFGAAVASIKILRASSDAHP